MTTASPELTPAQEAARIRRSGIREGIELAIRIAERFTFSGWAGSDAVPVVEALREERDRTG